MTKMERPARYGSGGIWQRGNVFWVRYRQVIRRADGVVTYKQHRESTGSADRDYAERFLRTKLQELGGRRPTVVDPKRISYEDIRDNRLANAAEEKKLRSLAYGRDGKPTLQTLTRLDAFFGGWKAADITTADIRRFRKQGTDDGLSNQRMNRYVAELSKMFHDAVEDGLITSAEMPLKFPKTEEKNEAKGAIFIDKKWYDTLQKALDEPLRSAFVLGYHYAVRVHEMRRLRWQNIDIKKRLVTLPGSITKTGNARVVPLPSDFRLKPGKLNDLVFPLGDFRDEWRAVCVKIGAGHYACRECGERCEGRVCPKHGKRLLREMCYRGLLLRHTRHTAIRNLSDTGLAEKRIMAISGHTTRSTFDRYIIGKDSDVEDVRLRVERLR